MRCSREAALPTFEFAEKKRKKVVCNRPSRGSLWVLLRRSKENTNSIFQKPSQLRFSPLQGAVDGAFADVAFFCDFCNGFPLKVNTHNGVPLQLGQFLPDDPLQAFQLYIRRQLGSEQIAT